jgi:L-2-hydroxyglutarate oxidase LhgO
MADTGITIIGGGVVGLAIAAELSAKTTGVLLVERREKYGQETSSRNSEVIHAGLYYPHGSLRARLCVEGRQMLYALCEKQGIAFKRITKIVTATSSDELPGLEKLYQHGLGNEVPLELLTGDQVHALEPHIASVGGILSPTTGIISAHALMDYFHFAASERGAQIQTHCEVVGIEKLDAGYRIIIREAGGLSSFTTERVINAAGLECDTIAQLAGIDVDAACYRIRYAKGNYFALPSRFKSYISRLVYPVPPKGTLGVHALLDLGGRIKFGPDLELLPDRTLNYAVDEKKRRVFAASVRRILPMVQDDDLTPDMSGIRPRIPTADGQIHDFVIREETDRGLPGFINLIGIESPGLTASPAIARFVASLMNL